MNNVLLNIILSLILLITVLIKKKLKLEPIVLLVLNLSQTFIGLGFLSYNLKNSIEFFVGIILLIIGYFWRKDFLIDKKQVKLQNKSKIKFVFLEFVIIFFVIYHFLVGGIPILSDNVEIKRFDFTSSGLMGIPGRMYLYGLPYLYMCSYFKDNSSNGKKNIKVILCIFLLSRILGGIKSGIIEVIIIYINLRYATNNSIKIKEFFQKKYLIIYPFLVLFMFKLTQSYKTMQGIKLRDFLYYVLDRSTVIQAMPLNSIFEMSDKKIIVQSNYLKDFIYFLSKYTKISTFDKSYFTTDNIVSAYIYNTPIVKESFFVPVTMTGFGELYLNNYYFVYIFMFGFGFLYSYLLNKSKINYYSPFFRAKMLFLAFILEGFLTKGGLAYSIINVLFLLVIFKMIELTGGLVESFFKNILKN